MKYYCQASLNTLLFNCLTLLTASLFTLLYPPLINTNWLHPSSNLFFYSFKSSWQWQPLNLPLNIHKARDWYMWDVKGSERVMDCFKLVLILCKASRHVPLAVVINILSTHLLLNWTIYRSTCDYHHLERKPLFSFNFFHEFNPFESNVNL